MPSALKRISCPNCVSILMNCRTRSGSDAWVNIIGLAGLAFAGLVSAGDTERQPTKDPNEKVCEDIGTVGTRLKVKRVCATRAEWVERRRQDRQDIERMQALGSMACRPSDSSKSSVLSVC